MGTALILLQFAIVLALIFKGARVGGIGLGIYGMVGVFILVFVFGMKPGNLPIDVMLIMFRLSQRQRLCRQLAVWTTWWDWLRNSCANILLTSLILVR